MADDIMLLDERISRLEQTVAQGFFELTAHGRSVDGHINALEGRVTRLEERMDRLEERMDRLEEQVSLLNRKMDVIAETIEGKIQSVLEHLAASMAEMRRMDVAMRKEHWADRRVIHAILKDHGIRVRSLDGRRVALPAGRRRPRGRRPRA